MNDAEVLPMLRRLREAGIKRRLGLTDTAVDFFKRGDVLAAKVMPNKTSEQRAVLLQLFVSLHREQGIDLDMPGFDTETDHHRFYIQTLETRIDLAEGRSFPERKAAVSCAACAEFYDTIVGEMLGDVMSDVGGMLEAEQDIRSIGAPFDDLDPLLQVDLVNRWRKENPASREQKLALLGTWLSEKQGDDETDQRLT